jgi:hypothetical protein
MMGHGRRMTDIRNEYILVFLGQECNTRTKDKVLG